MKVLHIVSNLSVRNGVMSVIMNYYRHFDTNNIEFDFLYFDDKEVEYKSEIEKIGGKVYKINRTKNPIKLLSQINRFIKKNASNYQIIHVHELYLISALIGIKKKNKSIKIIAHAHATKFSENKLKAIRNRIMSIPNAFVPNYLFACSKDAGVAIFGKRFKDIGNIMNNSIDVSKFYPNNEERKALRNQLKIEDKYVIGHVGNFNIQKNHEFLIDVFNELQKDKDNVVLILVGDGELRKNIIEKCERLGISDKIIYLGTRNDVNKIMNAFDCFVFPSIYEGLGIVLIEAQATGIPCVFSDVVPKEANIIKENNTTISLKSDLKVWTKAIIDSQNKKIENPKKRIQEAGYDINIEAKEMQEFYRKIVE